MLKEIRSEKIQRVRNINDDLASHILQGTRTDEGTNTKRQAAKAVKLYQRVRKQACDLFSIFRDKLDPSACQCAENHGVGLRMELRDVGKTISGFDKGLDPLWNYEKDPLKFRAFITLTFDSGNEWRETDIEFEDELPEKGEKASDPPIPREEPTRPQSALQVPPAEYGRSVSSS